MRRNEIQEFAQELHKLERRYGVVMHSDNYYTHAIISDKRSNFSYHYDSGKIKLDENTFLENEDIEY